MRRFTCIFAALLYFVATITAQASLLVNPYISFPAAGGGGSTPSVTFLQCSAENTTNQTTYTFTSQNVGTASADRYTAGVVLARDGLADFTVSSATVGGNAVTLSENTTNVSVLNFAAVFILANPTGTSQTVAVTMSESIEAMQVCLWQVNNIASGTKTDSISASAGAGVSATLDNDVSANGVAIGGCVTGTVASTHTWTGLTERADGPAGTEITTTVADFTNDASGDTPLAITAQGTTGGVNCAVASYL